MTTHPRRAAGRAAVATLLLSFTLSATGCEEIGNPLPGTAPGASAGQLVRENDSAIGPLVIEARYVAPEQLRALLVALGDDVDYVDPSVPARGAVVVVMVRPTRLDPTRALPPRIHLVSDFAYENGTRERRVWIARTERARFIGVFGLRAIPTDVHTTTM
jgi:hypothetical protein